MARILGYDYGKGIQQHEEPHHPFEGTYRCSQCGAIVELDYWDIMKTDDRHRVDDFDGRGKRIRTVPTFLGYEGSPCCKQDASLWEVK